jgi:hypothetical protein
VASVRIVAVAVAVVLVSAVPVFSSDFEEYCNLEGFAAPVRQTLLVLDEHHVSPEGGTKPDPKNAP